MTYDPVPLFVAYEALQSLAGDETKYDATWEALWAEYLRLSAEAPRCDTCGDTPIFCPKWDEARRPSW